MMAGFYACYRDVKHILGEKRFGEYIQICWYFVEMFLAFIMILKVQVHKYVYVDRDELQWYYQIYAMVWSLLTR